jgi:hypothetical protein
MVRVSRSLRVAATVLVLGAGAALSAGCGGDGGGSSTPNGGGPNVDVAPTDLPGIRPGLTVGIGEQQSAMFADPRFLALTIRHARLVVSYDTTRVRFERELVDNWMRAAGAAGVEPFVTFGHSRVHPRKLPSVAEFRSAFTAFRKRYPQVRVYAAWNEINHASQPTSKNPARAAQYYNVVKAECGGCTVLAGDLLDQPGMTRYLARYRRGLDGTPSIWGLHNYADANRFRKSGLGALLRAVKGDVWLTETGGIVAFGRSFPRDEQRAAKATKYVLDLAADTPRVKRVYLYNWTGSKPTDRFDAGLIGPDGKARPAYAALKKALGGS